MLYTFSSLLLQTTSDCSKLHHLKSQQEPNPSVKLLVILILLWKNYPRKSTTTRFSWAYSFRLFSVWSLAWFLCLQSWKDAIEQKHCSPRHTDVRKQKGVFLSYLVPLPPYPSFGYSTYEARTFPHQTTYQRLYSEHCCFGGQTVNNWVSLI